MSEDAAQNACRRYPRLPRSRPVFLKPRADPDGTYGRLAVVGGGGAEVVSDRALEPGTEVDVEIYLAGAYIALQGRTTSCRRAAGRYLVGIAFAGCSPDQQALLAALMGEPD